MRRIMLMLRVCLCALIIAAAASGQVVTATIYGTVQDADGSVVPGAKVAARNVGTGATTTRISDQLGAFVISSLQVGEYEVTVEADGFKSYRRSGLRLAAGQDANLILPLEIGTLTETVEVTAETPLLNTVNAEQRNDLEGERVEELPISRRDWTNTLNLGTGIQLTGGTVRMNGLAPASFRLTVDGTDATQDTELPSFSMSGNFNFIKSISTEAIGEINIAKGIASAEIANTMSGNVNVTTKSGTNSFHGSGFWLFNVEELNARNQFLSSRPNLTYNQFGGSLGGPIVKNKMFFFGVYEGYRLRGFQSLSDDVPTPEFKQMVSQTTNIYDNVLSLFPDPNSSYAPGAITGRWFGAGSEIADDNHVVARGDYHITDTTILSTRYTRSRPIRTVPRVVSANNRTWTGTVEQGNVNVTHMRPTITFETRIGINYNQSPRNDGIYGLYANDVSFNGIRGLGFEIDGETIERQGWSWSVEEMMGKVVGRHALKFGGLYMRTNGRRINAEVPILQYNSVADLLNNIPSGRQVTMGVGAYLASFNTLGIFIQDDFRVNSRLTLNLGIRYDYFTVPKEMEGKLFNRDGPFGTGPYLPPDEIWQADRNNFSPRIGFAYQLNESATTVLRGGVGMFHNPRPLFGGPVDLTRDAIDAPFRVNFSRQDALQNPEIFTWPISNANVADFVRGSTGLESGTAINPDFPYPFSYQWNLTVQQALGAGFVLDTGYHGTRGVNLMMVRFWNPPDRVTGIRPVPGFAEFRYRDAGESTAYHSWQSSLRKRFQAGFSFGINYTFANSYSYTNDGDLLLPASVQDVYNVRADKGRPNQDIRHAFVSDFVYEMPFARLTDRQSFLTRNLLEGWQVAGILTVQSGQPLNVSHSTAYQNSRADFVGGEYPVFENHRDTLVYIDSTAFAPVPIGEVSGVPIRPGNVGRNALTGPGLWNIDLSLSKRLFFTEQLRAKFDVEMLNGFNHTNYSGIETRVERNTFGRINSTRGARVVQLGLRFEF